MIRFFVKKKYVSAKGNRFARCIHDGGTLDSKQKYQAFAMQATDISWRKNVVVCVAFAHHPDGRHDSVATKLEQVFKERCGFSVDQMVGSMTSDVAAYGVGDRFHVRKDKCNMHQFNKLGDSASGDLQRSKGKVVVNAFKEGQALLKLVVDCANFFSRSKETE